ESASKRLESPSLTLPALFTIQYACAQLWMEMGIKPASMIGHSMGEYTAACLAGVFSLKDALALVSMRGKLFETLEDGSMLSVPLTESELQPMLGEELSFAAINHFDSCVLSGPTPKIEALQQKLEARDVECTRLRISVAAHSAMVEPILDPFKEFLDTIHFAKPKIPFVSNLSGNWVTGDEVTTPEYWLRHLRETVRFAGGLSCLLEDEHLLLLEMGPGRTLSSFARAHPEKKTGQVTVTSLRHPREEVADIKFLNTSIGWLWAAGVPLKWDKILPGKLRRVPLPTYPFERKTYWVEPQKVLQQAVATSGNEERNISEDINVTTVKALPSRAERVGDELQRIIHELSGVDMSAIERDTSFLELGFDSLFLTQANSAFQKLFKVKISFRQLFEEAPTINLLAAFIDEKMPPEAFPAPDPEPVAVQETVATPVQHAVSTSAQPVQAAHSQPIQVSAEPGTMQHIVQQQLQLMQQQLQLLGAVPQQVATQPTPADAPSPSSPYASVQENTPAVSSNGKKGDGAAHGPWKPVQRKRANEYTDRQINALETLIADYTKKTAGSKALTQSQRPRLADPRAITGFRHVWKEMIYQIAGVRSKGSRIWDVDGNEYIDLNMGFGINFFGHSPDFVVEAVEEQLAKGMELGVLTPLAKEVAELICELTKMDRVNFVNTGSEAVSAAVRAARTASGKDRIAVFRKDYHGISDEFLVRPVDLRGKRISKPVSPGIPDFLVENVIILEYDDTCLDVIREHADDLAGVIFEPVPAHDPAFQPREIIHKVRELTRELDIAMIFDELITGFRLHPRGAQGFYDVDVDICAYGKIVCGGLPMAAVAGSAKYMNAFDGGMWQFGDDSYPEGGVTFFGGTFVRHPLCLSSSRAVLQKMQENGTRLHDELNIKTEAFAADVNNIFKQHHAPMEMVYCASMILIRFLEDGPFNPLFWFYLRLNGVLFRDRSGFLCVDHSPEDLKKVLKAIEDSVLQMKAADFMPGQDAAEDSSFLGLDGQSIELPLTPSQVEIWLASQLGEKASCAFNLSSRLTLKGTFDMDVLQRSVDQLTKRHEALRTTFSPDGSMQYVAKEISVNPSYVDLSELDNSTGEEMLAEICEEDVRTAFDLESGPLIRFHVVRTRPDQHEIIMSAHHIICDGWSFGVLLKDLAAFYSANEGGEHPRLADPLQFRDFVDIQNENLEIVGSSSKDYWQSQYSESVPVLELPTDHPRPRNRSYAGGYRRVKLDAEIFRGIQKFATEQRSTTFGVLMAAYGSFLSRLSSQEDVVVGLAAAGQTAIGKQEVVGHCVTLLPIRLPVPGEQAFVDYFGQMKNLLMEAYDHQDYTFGDLLSSLGIERDPSRLPLVSTMITYETGSEKLQFGGLDTDVTANPKGYCNFDLELYLLEDKGELTMRMEYNSELFNASTIERWLKHFQVMLSNIISDYETPIQKLAMIPSSDLQRMMYSWNDTQTTYPAERGMHELFEEQADYLKEDAIAAIYPLEDKKNISYSYSELEQRANRLANYLIKNGVKEGDFIGVYLPEGKL
ncbi:MAG: aminotransferase class III-fold pyridoxal phosphate-dependent enzyme, partial [Calditrichota bacterium]